MALPEYTASTRVQPLGVVRADRTLEAGLTSLGRVAGQAAEMGGQAQLEAALADATRKGLAAGIQRGPDGRLVFQLLDDSTAANRAYNEAALEGYRSSFLNDNRQKIGELAIKHRGDPAAFEQAALGLTEGALQGVPESFKAELQLDLTDLTGTTLAGLLTDKQEADFKLATEALQDRYEYEHDNLVSLWFSGGTNTEESRKAEQSLMGMIDRMVTLGTVNEDGAQVMRDKLADELLAYHAAGQAVRKARELGPEAGRQELERMMTEPEFAGLGFEKLSSIRTLANSMMGDAEAQYDVQVKQIGAALDTLESNFGTAHPEQFLYQEQVALRLGNTALAARASLGAQAASTLKNYAGMSFPDLAAEAERLQGSVDRTIGGAPQPIFDAIVNVGEASAADAVSPKGAVGLAQVLPSTAREVAAGLGMSNVAAMDDAAITGWLKTPENSLLVGRAYFDQLRAEFGSDMLAAAAYNAGPQRVREWLGTYGDPRTGRVAEAAWAALIPLQETRDYVARVMSAAGQQPETLDIYLRDQAQILLRQKAKQIEEDSLLYGATTYRSRVGALAEVDWSNPEQFGPRVAGRLQQVDYMESREGFAFPVLTSAEFSRLGSAFETGDAGQVSTIMATLRDSLGSERFYQTMGTLAALSPPGSVASYASAFALLDRPEDAGARMMLLGAIKSGSTEDARKLLASGVGDNIDEVIDDRAADFLGTFGPADGDIAGRLQDAMRLIAYSAARRGDPAGAAEQAVQAFAGQYQVVDTYRVPLGIDAGRVQNGLGVVLDDLGTRALDVPGGFNPAVGQDFTIQQYANAIRDNGGFWRNAPDESGVQLFDPAGIPVTVRGVPLIVKWDEALKMQDRRQRVRFIGAVAR